MADAMKRVHAKRKEIADGLDECLVLLNDLDSSRTDELTAIAQAKALVYIGQLILGGWAH